MAKKEVRKIGPLTEGKKEIIAKLIEEYDIETATDIQDAIADLLGGTIKGMMEAEMSNHLGYEKAGVQILIMLEMVTNLRKFVAVMENLI